MTPDNPQEPENWPHSNLSATVLLELSLLARTKRLLNSYDLRPRKALSQNFLINDETAEALAESVTGACAPDTLLIEIGAGLGALTVPLARSGRDLIAYETDQHLIQPLETLMSAFPQVSIRHQDITEEDLGTVQPGRRLAIAGNLPYHLTGLLLRRMMEVGHRCDICMATMQAEVADRLIAKPGDDEYGILTVFADYYLEQVRVIRRLRPGVFMPPPSVDSIAVTLHPRTNPAEHFGLSRNGEAALIETIRAAFGHRRKTVRNSMTSSPHITLGKREIKAALDASGVDGTARAETLGIDEFIRIAAQIAEFRAGDA